jgi:hypothetical protein
LTERGNPAARIKKNEVTAAFGKRSKNSFHVDKKAALRAHSLRQPWLSKSLYLMLVVRQLSGNAEIRHLNLRSRSGSLPTLAVMRCASTVCGVCPTPLTSRRKSCTR